MRHLFLSALIVLGVAATATAPVFPTCGTYIIPPQEGAPTNTVGGASR